jgi:beta-N-acetylhexosaminidase
MTTLKKLIGQLCIFGFDGTNVPEWIRRVISEWNLGGVILFKRNIVSKEQLIELIRELKSLATEIPLFISVDHEGGRVFRLPPPFTQIPTARQIGQNYVGAGFPRPDVVQSSPRPTLEKSRLHDIVGGETPPLQVGSLMGRELREVGFNLNFVPVLDVDTNPNNPIIGDRSYGSDPQLVSKVALDIIQGLRSEKVIPCGKHFPGHGDTSRDSHLELPVVDQPLSRLEEVELIPFRAAIQDKLEMLMTAHVLYPQIDPDYPATLSQKILTGLLREKLGYDGVVISDDFLMKAISDRYGIGEAARLFLEAGGDIPLICRDEGEQEKMLEYLEKAVREGGLLKMNLEQSVNRVMFLKQRFI